MSIRPVADGWLDCACEFAGALLALSAAFDPDWLAVPDRDASEGTVDWALWPDGVELCEDVEFGTEEFDEAAGEDEVFEWV